jgi:signal-transduction protein with cAMP-binding, CBS, and nucleotidyltransferase domain
MNPTKPIKRAKDVMISKIFYIDGIATAAEAAQMMRKNNAEALIVNKRHEDDVFGIVVIQDLVTGVILKDLEPTEVNVYEVMSKPIISVPAEMDIRYVARLLIKTGIRRAPVEENGQFIGMISLNSLILDNMLF